MSLGMRQEVKKAGVVVGYVEHVALGDLWRAVSFGVAPYLPPMFGEKGVCAGVREEIWKTG